MLFQPLGDVLVQLVIKQAGWTHSHLQGQHGLCDCQTTGGAGSVTKRAGMNTKREWPSRSPIQSNVQSSPFKQIPKGGPRAVGLNVADIVRSNAGLTPSGGHVFRMHGCFDQAIRPIRTVPAAKAGDHNLLVHLVTATGLVSEHQCYRELTRDATITALSEG
mmetsp:Transcript_28194/g.78850  ORF Transcript_28194/g.78850 Transcript_28194/m.78850 type:complete len:162 (+) Transcript_28194:223-708(+)